MKRRDFILGTAALGLFTKTALASASPTEHLQSAEQVLSARIGLYAQNLATGQSVHHRADERFALCSTFKASLSALCLQRADQGQLDLQERLTFQASDLLPTSPVTKDHASTGAMTVKSLCQAIVEYSDNTAANLLLTHVGGPAAVTQFFRDIGDSTSRLDRMEMALNANIPGDERDTTTPRAMAENLRQLILEPNRLSKPSRDLLVQWMRNEQNAKNRIRAAVPTNWTVANKPGTSFEGAANDIAVLWSPAGDPFLVTIYIDTRKKEKTRTAVAAIKDIADLALKAVL